MADPLIQPDVVLLIEDDGGIRYVIDSVLTRKGYTVVCGATLAEGVALLKRQPKWLVLDIRLPDGNGLTLLRTIRDQHLPVKVVVITTDPRLLDGIEELKPDKVWVKPVIVGELVSWMKAAEPGRQPPPRPRE